MNMKTQDMLASVRLPTPLDPELKHSLETCGQTVTVEAGTTLFHPGQEMETFLIVGSGVVRVFKSSDDGREITLYQVCDGECCTLNILCLLTGRPSPATAYIEEDLTALTYPRAQFLDWFARYPSMRDMVLGQMADRVDTMMTLVEEVAFQKLDRRLAAYLLTASADADNTELSLTHEVIARDLGSVREVVSRILKNFECMRLVSLGRGRIAVLDREGLANLCS